MTAPSRPATLADLWPAIAVGHVLGDYVAQTNKQSCEKAHPGYNITQDVPYWHTWLANQGHCASYHLTMTATVALAARAAGVRIRPRRAAAALALSWASHALIDRRWPVKKVMYATGSKDWYDKDPGAAPLVDQALHLGFLLAAGVILTHA